MTRLDEALALIDSGRSAEGLDLLRQLASAGDPRALYVVAYMIWSGSGMEQDPARARLVFEYAASAGDGQSNLFFTNLLGSGIAGKRDWRLSIERLEDEARQLPERRAAIELIGRMDLDADGNARSTPEAQFVSDRPYARLFKRLLTAEECAYLVSASQSRFEPSMVYNRERELVRDTIRTSDGATFDWLVEDPAVHAINRRIAAVSNTSYDQGEALQVLRYSAGQEYRPHFDYVEGADNRRLWTALVYLNDDYEGGSTAFVRTAIEVQGETGDVLLFRNAAPDDSRDLLAEHAGMPITAGTKFLATRWIREARWIP